jgi:hypothetical protein
MDYEKAINTISRSIDKWYGVTFKGRTENGHYDCELCHVYRVQYDDSSLLHCIACPIYSDTGEPGCHVTPYFEWVCYNTKKFNFYIGPCRVFDEKSKELALKELNYLRALKGYLEVLQDEKIAKNMDELTPDELKNIMGLGAQGRALL